MRVTGRARRLVEWLIINRCSRAPSRICRARVRPRRARRSTTARARRCDPAQDAASAIAGKRHRRARRTRSTAPSRWSKRNSGRRMPWRQRRRPRRLTRPRRLRLPSLVQLARRPGRGRPPRRPRLPRPRRPLRPARRPWRRAPGRQLRSRTSPGSKADSGSDPALAGGRAAPPARSGWKACSWLLRKPLRRRRRRSEPTGRRRRRNLEGAAPAIAIKGAISAAPANLAKVIPSAQTREEGSGAPNVVASRGENEPGLATAPEVPVEVDRSGSVRADSEGLRPQAPTVAAEKRKSWPWLALAVVLGIVLSVAAAAIVMRQKPQDLAIAPPEPHEEAAPPPPAKIAQRAQPSPADDKAPAPPASEPSGAQPGAQPAVQSPTEQPPANAAAETPIAGQLPSAARAAMLIASADNPQKPVVNLGSTVWSTIPPRAGPAGDGRGEGGCRHSRPQDARDNDLEEEHRSDPAGDAYDRSEIYLRRRRADRRLQGRRRCRRCARLDLDRVGSADAASRSKSATTTSLSRSPRASRTSHATSI